MKITTLSLVTGIIVGGLGILGLIAGEGRVMQEMNINLMLDLARTALGAFLVFGGLKSPELAKAALSVFGVAYLGMFVLGLVSPTLFGMLPAGLGVIDQTLHLGGGIAGMYVGLTPKHKTSLSA